MFWDSYPGGVLWLSKNKCSLEKRRGVGVCKTMLGDSWGVISAVQISVYRDYGTPAACIGGVGVLWSTRYIQLCHTLVVANEVDVAFDVVVKPAAGEILSYYCLRICKTFKA
jgi:hypothetical protein